MSVTPRKRFKRINVFLKGQSIPCEIRFPCWNTFYSNDPDFLHHCRAGEWWLKHGIGDLLNWDNVEKYESLGDIYE